LQRYGKKTYKKNENDLDIKKVFLYYTTTPLYTTPYVTLPPPLPMSPSVNPLLCDTLLDVPNMGAQLLVINLPIKMRLFRGCYIKC
jgi:hypothetical protein